MNNLYKIVILDFTSGRTLVLDYDTNIYNEPEDFFDTPEMIGISINYCEFMMVPASEFTIEFNP